MVVSCCLPHSSEMSDWQGLYSPGQANFCNKQLQNLSVLNKSIGGGNGTPLQYSCLENPIDGGAWWAAVHGVSKSRTRLSDFTLTFHFYALEKEMAADSSALAWRTPGMVSHRVRRDRSNLAAAAAASQRLFPLSHLLVRCRLEVVGCSM